MPNLRMIHLLGYASGVAGAGKDRGNGPLIMKESSFLSSLSRKGIDIQWEEILKIERQPQQTKLAFVAELCQKLALQVNSLTDKKKFFTVLGGDHSSAIGTWSGAYHSLKKQGPLGLIWVDAHMDSHTLETSMSGNIHGMPLACLLGYGMPSLTRILDHEPKIKPQHLCLIGIRSFERAEAALLKELNVRVFFMEEVKQRGLNAVMRDAINIVKQETAGFGVSIDIDSLDPMDAPGTGVAEPNGIRAKDLCLSLQTLINEPKLIGAEIVEFDPERDQNQKTEKLIAHIIAILGLGNRYHEIFEDCCVQAATADM